MHLLQVVYVILTMCVYYRLYASVTGCIRHTNNVCLLQVVHLLQVVYVILTMCVYYRLYASVTGCVRHTNHVCLLQVVCICYRLCTSY